MTVNTGPPGTRIGELPTRRRRVVVADTDLAARAALRDVLERAGLEVTEAHTSSEVADQAADADVVVLTDLPEATAAELTSVLRSGPATRQVAIVHRSGAESHAAALTAGADAHLADPVEPELLLATVATVLRARHAQDRLALVLSTPGIGVWEWQLEDDRVWWSPSLEEIHGFPPGSFPGDFDAFAASIHPDQRDEVVARVQQAAASGEELEVNYRFVRTDGTVGWLDGRGRLFRDPETGDRRMVGLGIDVTERVERARALEALVGMSLLLTATVTTTEVVRILAEGAGEVTGAEGLALVLVDDGDRTVVLDRPAGTLPGEAGSPVEVSLADGRTRWFPNPSALAEHFPEASADTDRHAAWAVLPLTVAGETFGAIWLAWERPQRLEPTVRNAIRAMAGLVAQAYRQAQLTERERLVAAELQRALLPTLPQLPGVELMGWYEPASDHDLVGGDWFDVVQRPDGSVVLLIGDVAGHGIEAASHTAEVRHTVRAIARTAVDPAEALVETAAVLEEGGTPFLTTALVVNLEPNRTRAMVASAGHPPPLIGRNGHAFEAEAAVGPPLRSGLPRPSGPSPVLDLEPGDVLVLYTDGLVERRGESIDEGIDRVAEVLESHHGSLETLVEQLVELTPEPEDDIGIIVARING